MKTLISLILLVFFTTTANATARYNFKPELGKVEFKTKGWPSLVTIKGEGKGVSGSLEETAGRVSGQLSFNLATLKTGIELRDNHMKDNYLEVKKHPTAVLKLKDLEIPENANGDLKFKGILVLHGQEKEVEGTGSLENDSGKITMKAEIPVKLSDFKIAIPSYKGITVAEKVKINFSTEVTKI